MTKGSKVQVFINRVRNANTNTGGNDNIRSYVSETPRDQFLTKIRSLMTVLFSSIILSKNILNDTDHDKKYMIVIVIRAIRYIVILCTVGDM